MNARICQVIFVECDVVKMTSRKLCHCERILTDVVASLRMNPLYNQFIVVGKKKELFQCWGGLKYFAFTPFTMERFAFDVHRHNGAAKGRQCWLGTHPFMLDADSL